MFDFYKNVWVGYLKEETEKLRKWNDEDVEYASDDFVDFYYKALEGFEKKKKGNDSLDLVYLEFFGNKENTMKLFRGLFPGKTRLSEVIDMNKIEKEMKEDYPDYNGSGFNSWFEETVWSNTVILALLEKKYGQIFLSGDDKEGSETGNEENNEVNEYQLNARIKRLMKDYNFSFNWEKIYVGKDMDRELGALYCLFENKKYNDCILYTIVPYYSSYMDIDTFSRDSLEKRCDEKQAYYYIVHEYHCVKGDGLKGYIPLGDTWLDKGRIIGRLNEAKSYVEKKLFMPFVLDKKAWFKKSDEEIADVIKNYHQI